MLSNFSHVILSIIILITLCFKFPKKLKQKDPRWLRNNIAHIVGTSFGIGGFLTLSIGLCLLAILRKWPTDYISPTAVGTSIFIVVIYLLVIAHDQWKTWVTDITRRYGVPQSSKQNRENDNNTQKDVHK